MHLFIVWENYLKHLTGQKIARNIKYMPNVPEMSSTFTVHILFSKGIKLLAANNGD